MTRNLAWIGPNGCGKSDRAESYAFANYGDSVCYIATLPTVGPHMTRILKHKAKRPRAWRLFECCYDGGDPLAGLEPLVRESDFALVDGLTQLLLILYNEGGLAGASAIFDKILGVFDRSAGFVGIVDVPWDTYLDFDIDFSSFVRKSYAHMIIRYDMIHMMSHGE